MLKLFRPNWLSLFFAGMGAMLAITSIAKDIDWNWKTECVGRFQLSVPGDIEYPVAPTEDVVSSSYPRYQFSDKSLAHYQQLFYDGELQIGTARTSTDLDDIKKQSEKEMAELIKDQLLIHNQKAADSITTIPLSIPDAFAWRMYGTAILYMRRNGLIFNWRQGGDTKEDLQKNLQKMQDFITGFRLRPAFDVPTTKGVCVPFAYIEDDGKKSRIISVVMRSKSHPDVVIHFYDNDAILNGSDITSKQAVMLMLHDYKYDSPKTGLLGIRSTKMDGRDASSAFARLSRENTKQEDFLYVAIVRGEEAGERDIPSLTLRIERIAKNAKGQEPISESEFKALAEHVFQSIQRRPVSDKKTN